MSHTSGYSLRSILAVMTYAAFVFIPLAKPSVWWATLIPAAACFLTVQTVSVFVTSGERHRRFWACFSSGVGAYLAAVLFVGVVASLRYRTDFWGDNVGMPIWNLIHSDEAFRTNRQQLTDYDLVSFIVSLHLIIATAVAGLAAMLAQLAASRRRT